MRDSGTITLLLKLSRPRFWLYTAGPYALGVVAASPSRVSVMSVENALWLIFFIFPANLLIYGINDVFDYESDCRNPKKTAYETLLQPERRMYVAGCTALACVPFIWPLLRTSSAAIFAMAAFLFFSIEYSAPPIRAKTKPFLDAAFNTLYVFPGVFGYLMLSQGRPADLRLFIAGSLWCAAMHAFSAIPDIDSDRAAAMRTVATTLGQKGTLVFCAICYGSASLLAAPALGIVSIFLGMIYLLMLAISRRDIFGIYRRFPLVNAAAGMLIFFTVLLRLP